MKGEGGGGGRFKILKSRKISWTIISPKNMKRRGGGWPIFIARFHKLYTANLPNNIQINDIETRVNSLISFYRYIIYIKHWTLILIHEIVLEWIFRKHVFKYSTIKNSGHHYPTLIEALKDNVSLMYPRAMKIISIAHDIILSSKTSWT